MLFAKVLTYSLNAYLDAQIAEELITYIQTYGKSFATKNTVAQKRAEKFTETTTIAELKKNPSYLIGIAYTQYYGNGLADILYARLIWLLFIVKQKSDLEQLYKESTASFCKQLTTPYQYEELIHKPGIILWYWPIMILNPWYWIQQFAKERCGYMGELNKDALQKAGLEVQYQNSRNNYQIAQVIKNHRNSNDPKVIELRKAALRLKNEHSFLPQAASTQESAARWDKLFIWLLNR